MTRNRSAVVQGDDTLPGDALESVGRFKFALVSDGARDARRVGLDRVRPVQRRKVFRADPVNTPDIPVPLPDGVGLDDFIYSEPVPLVRKFEY